MKALTIDCEYVMPQLAASYLREEGGEVAFIEANTSHAVPRLMEALTKANLRPEAVKYIIVTHVHLDHAGGASALMKACPRAVLLAHPRAVKHLVEPAKLVASAQHVYGEALFASLYGRIEPIDAARVHSMDDGSSITLGPATFRFHHTRGHANHHFVVHDEAKRTIYTGDAFGLVYPAMQRAKRLAYPSTSPTDFDGPAAIESVERIMSLKPEAVALTHFGLFEDVQTIGNQLKHWLELSTRWVEEGTQTGDEQKALEQRYKGLIEKQFTKAAADAGLVLTPADHQLLKIDLELNAQGLAFAAIRQRQKRNESIS